MINLAGRFEDEHERLGDYGIHIEERYVFESLMGDNFPELKEREDEIPETPQV